MYETEWMNLKDNLHRLEIVPEFEHLVKNGFIYRFDGTEYRFLSNFYMHEITYKGKVYASTEHAYQAMKTLDEDWAEAIRLAETPSKAKKKGGLCPLRPDWDEIKDQIMDEVLALKFADPELEQSLIDTYQKYLVEGVTWHDNFWGICLKRDCERGCLEKTGKNHLGLALMRLREKLTVQRIKEEVEMAKYLSKSSG